jgi:hypothetical protein
MLRQFLSLRTGPHPGFPQFPRGLEPVRWSFCLDHIGVLLEDLTRKQFAGSRIVVPYPFERSLGIGEDRD